MMNLIGKFFNKDKLNKSHIRHDFSSYFFSLPEHQWIHDISASAQFENLFSHLPIGVLDAMMKKYPITFMTSDDFRKKNNQGMSLTNSIVVFPQFQKMLKENQSYSVAYLAHELAFVLYELEELKKDPLMAEVEADKFVCDIGFGEELEQFLLKLDETTEKRLRLTYLTIDYFSRHGNY